MTTEELKLIVELIGQLGEISKEIFIWWLVINYVLKYMVVAILLGCVTYCTIYICRLIKACQNECVIVRELAKKAGVRPEHFYSPAALNQISEWIRNQ